MSNYYYITDSTTANSSNRMDNSGSQFMIIPPPTDVSSIQMVMTFRIYNTPEHNSQIIEGTGGYTADVSTNLYTPFLQRWSCYIVRNTRGINGGVKANTVASIGIVAAPAAPPAGDLSFNVLDNWMGESKLDIY